MTEHDEGLNDREELLNELRFFLRYEEELIGDGWYSESDFYEIVFELIKELAKQAASVV